MREHGRPTAFTLDKSDGGDPIGWNLSTPAGACLVEAGEWVWAALTHVSEAFIEALALGRPTSIDVAAGLKHISCCQHCGERLDVERKLIGLIRSACVDHARLDGESWQGRLLIVNASSESKG